MDISDIRINHSINHDFTGTGKIGEVVKASSRSFGHVLISGVGSTNVVIIKGRIVGGTDTTIKTITGPTSGFVFDAANFDDIEFECTTFEASGSPKLRASFFIFDKFLNGVINQFPQISDVIPNETPSALSLNRMGGAWNSIIDFQTHSAALVLPSGTINTAEIIRLVGGNFGSSGGLLAHDWTETFVGTGSTSIADGELRLNTGITANSAASVRSFRRAPFSAATHNLSHLAFSLTNIFNANVTRRFGAYNPDDSMVNGVYFQFLNGNGSSSIDIELITIKNNVIIETVIESAFNGSNIFVKNSNIHIYEHIYNAGTVYWFQDRKLIHRSVALDTAAFGTPDLQVGMEIINTSGNTVDNEIVTRGAAISRMGANSAIPRFFPIIAAGTFFIKNTSGELVRIIVNDKGVGAAEIIIYNSTTASGEIIGTVDTADVQGSVEFGNNFDLGLTLVVSGGSVDLTIIYD